MSFVPRRAETGGLAKYQLLGYLLGAVPSVLLIAYVAYRLSGL